MVVPLINNSLFKKIAVDYKSSIDKIPTKIPLDTPEPLVNYKDPEYTWLILVVAGVVSLIILTKR